MESETPLPEIHSRRNALVAVGVFLLVAAAAWFLTHSGRGARNSRQNGRPPVTVGVAKVILTDMPVSLTAIGTAQPVTTATVRAQETGVLFSLDFTEGQMVQQGQLLARIDPRPYQLALTQAQANLARDQAQFNSARVDLNRYQTLWAQDSIAHQQVDTQAALVKQLEGTIGADQAAIGTAKLNLGYTAIVAPVSGRIGLRQADVGNYLTPNDTNGIAVITVTRPIDVAFSLPQSQIATIQQRQRQSVAIPVTARDQTGAIAIARGTFLTFDNEIDATSGTVKAKARFSNADGKLFPNQFVNVSILADSLANAFTVPVNAVRHGARGDFVFELMPDRKVKLRLVKTGPSDGNNIAILTGITAGTTVVTEGADGLDDGSPVILAGDKRRGAGQ